MRLSFLVTVLIYRSIIFAGSAQKFSPPQWEGHWESFSKYHNDILVATLDISKIKGKEYTFKVWINPDFNGTDDQSCPEKTFEDTATWNGANGLNTIVKGIGFVYYQETAIINIFHDYSDQELTDLSICFDAGDLKKVNN